VDLPTGPPGVELKNVALMRAAGDTARIGFGGVRTSLARAGIGVHECVDGDVARIDELAATRGHVAAVVQVDEWLPAAAGLAVHLDIPLIWIDIRPPSRLGQQLTEGFAGRSFAVVPQVFTSTDDGALWSGRSLHVQGSALRLRSGERTNSSWRVPTGGAAVRPSSEYLEVRTESADGSIIDQCEFVDLRGSPEIVLEIEGWFGRCDVAQLTAAQLPLWRLSDRS
jgi:hypothetical protein